MTDKKQQNFHFIGIGGSGMSGVAHLCLEDGHRVSGSDLRSSNATSRLEKGGAIIHFPHNSSNIDEEPVVVVSSAIPESNVELLTAQKLGLTIKKRAEVLGWFMKGKQGISVAGCHGKTTTTSLVSSILTVANMDPTTVVGGEASHVGGNAKFGHGKYLVAEADESDGSFLCLPSKYSIVTNVDNDHLDHYGSFEAIQKAFLQFLDQTEEFAVICGDDPVLRELACLSNSKVVSYGFDPSCDYRIELVEEAVDGTEFKIHHEGECIVESKTAVPGLHNVLNSSAAIALCHKLGVEASMLDQGIRNFGGVQRRFELVQKKGELEVFDDYAHHPAEVKATLRAARQRLKGRDGKLVVCFQAHRFSRMKHIAHEFAHAFSEADFLYLAPIYAAGECVHMGMDVWSIVKHLEFDPSRVCVLPHADWSLVGEMMKQELRDGDLFLTMGAGDVTRLGREMNLG